MIGRKARWLVILAFIGLLALGGVFLLSKGWNASRQVLDLPDGAKYEGEVVNGKPNGKGVAVYPPQGERTGDRYEGDWVDGRFHGKGTLTWHGGSYEGDFVDGKPHGRGTLSDEGWYYEGDFLRGYFHGKGTLEADDGRHY